MSQNLEVVYLPLERLTPYTGNPRTHSKAQIEQIARSIQAFGFINPVVTDQQ